MIPTDSVKAMATNTEHDRGDREPRLLEAQPSAGHKCTLGLSHMQLP